MKKIITLLILINYINAFSFIDFFDDTKFNQKKVNNKKINLMYGKNISTIVGEFVLNDKGFDLKNMPISNSVNNYFSLSYMLNNKYVDNININYNKESFTNETKFLFHFGEDKYDDTSISLNHLNIINQDINLNIEKSFFNNHFIYPIIGLTLKRNILNINIKNNNIIVDDENISRKTSFEKTKDDLLYSFVLNYNINKDMNSIIKIKYEVNKSKEYVKKWITYRTNIYKNRYNFNIDLYNEKYTYKKDNDFEIRNVIKSGIVMNLGYYF